MCCDVCVGMLPSVFERVTSINAEMSFIFVVFRILTRWRKQPPNFILALFVRSPFMCKEPHHIATV